MSSTLVSPLRFRLFLEIEKRHTDPRLTNMEAGALLYRYIYIYFDTKVLVTHVIQLLSVNETRRVRTR